jgi:hypothetical protein
MAGATLHVKGVRRLQRQIAPLSRKASDPLEGSNRVQAQAEPESPQQRGHPACLLCCNILCQHGGKRRQTVRGLSGIYPQSSSDQKKRR